MPDALPPDPDVDGGATRVAGLNAPIAASGMTQRCAARCTDRGVRLLLVLNRNCHRTSERLLSRCKRPTIAVGPSTRLTPSRYHALQAHVSWQRPLATSSRWQLKYGACRPEAGWAVRRWCVNECQTTRKFAIATACHGRNQRRSLHSTTRSARVAETHEPVTRPAKRA